MSSKKSTDKVYLARFSLRPNLLSKELNLEFNLHLNLLGLGFSIPIKSFMSILLNLFLSELKDQILAHGGRLCDFCAIFARYCQTFD